MKLRDKKRIEGFEKVCEKYIGADWVSEKEVDEFCKSVGSYVFHNMCEHLRYEYRFRVVKDAWEEWEEMSNMDVLDVLNSPDVNYEYGEVNSGFHFEFKDGKFFRVYEHDAERVCEVKLLAKR